MSNDTTERGLERLICAAMTGSPCEPTAGPGAGESEAGVAAEGTGWICGKPDDRDREYCVDLGQLLAFLVETQPESFESLQLDEDGPARRKFLARVQGEVSRRGVIDVLRKGVKHGHVHEIGSREERLRAIANEYAKDPHSTLVVSPDNLSRQDLNDVIHRAMQREGQVSRDEHQTTVLSPRQEITGADRQCAERYEEGDIVRYSHGSKVLGIEPGDYARIERVDAKTNQLTVKADDDRRFSYDPRRLQGVTLYREAERALAAGDRVQMTAPDRERGVPNRELGTVERVDRSGHMEVRWDSGRTSSFEASARRHLDYGYAVTSHSSQGQTAGRVLVHVRRSYWSGWRC